MNESKTAKEFYQGYSKPFMEKNDDRVDYAFHVHFQGKENWGNVIDFGGRLGQKTRKLSSVVVVEIDGEARQWMKNNGIAAVERIEAMPDGCADTIYCSHVLEHLESPLEYLRLFKAKLKPTGRLILILPYEQTIKAEVCTNGHLYAWNATTIATILKRAGFKVWSCEYSAVMTMGKIIGYGPYNALIRNPVINTATLWLKTLTCSATGNRTVGEFAIVAGAST